VRTASAAALRTKRSEVVPGCGSSGERRRVAKRRSGWGDAAVDGLPGLLGLWRASYLRPPGLALKAGPCRVCVPCSLCGGAPSSPFSVDRSIAFSNTPLFFFVCCRDWIMSETHCAVSGHGSVQLRVFLVVDCPALGAAEHQTRICPGQTSALHFKPFVGDSCAWASRLRQELRTDLWGPCTSLDGYCSCTLTLDVPFFAGACGSCLRR